MALLEIRYRSGQIERRELSKRIPLVVGHLATCDIRAEADSIAAVHCRIAWNRNENGFEVTAATSAGVQWNGTSVPSAMLSPGDVLRVGDMDIVLEPDAQQVATPAPSTEPPGPVFEEIVEQSQALSSQISLKPITIENMLLSPLRDPPRAPPRPVVEPPPRSESSPPASPPESFGFLAARVLPGKPGKLEKQAEAEAELAAAEEFPSPPLPKDTRARPAAVTQRVRDAWESGAARPGEQDVLRSPLVLGLGAAAVVLLLASLTLWFVLTREAAQRKFDVSAAAVGSGYYAEGIEGLERFLQDHPRHRRAAEARVMLASARVDQALTGALPAWERGLEMLEEFLKQYRDGEEFQSPDSETRKFALRSAEKLALGAATAAGATRRQELLGVSAAATQLLELYSPSDNPPRDALRAIADATAAAQSAILRQATFDAAVEHIDAALGENQPLAALTSYRQLLDRYDTFSGSKPLAERLKKALQLEQERSVRKAEAVTAATAEAAPTAPPRKFLSLHRRTRTRTDEASLGQQVVAVAEDCCFGIDTVTGEPLWRRVVGVDLPFFPLPVSSAEPALLVFDTRHNELLLIRQKSGDTVWRLPLADRPAAAPLVHEGQIYLATAGGHLLQFNLDSGELHAQVDFEQPLAGAPVLSHSGDRLYVAGQETVLYVLTRKPLACERVVYLGHAAGSVEAPLLMLRSYLLVCESDRLRSTRLRLLSTEPESGPPVQIAVGRVDGQVRQSPVLRGKQLYVPSDPERVSAFSISETNDKHALAPVASYAVKNSDGGTVYLAAGPDDQLWMVGTALRRLHLGKAALRPDKLQIAAGLTSQPLQSLGDALFSGRYLPYSRAVLFGRGDRLRMTGQWQISLGAPILACSATSAKDGAVITSLGEVFQISADKLRKGGFDLQPVTQLPIPAKLATGLRCLSLADGRLAVHCGGEQPRLWTLAPDGSLDQELKLEQGLEADPLLFNDGLLLPRPGKLSHVRRTAEQPALEDFLLPIQEPVPQWKQVAELDPAQVVVLDRKGRIARLQRRTSPAPHLAEVAHWDGPVPIDVPIVVTDGKVLLADSQSKLRMLDADSLEVQAEQTLDRPPTQGPWLLDGRVLVETGGDRLAAFDLANSLESLWTLPLDGVSLAGSPQSHQTSLLVALQDGRLLALEPATGTIKKQTSLEQGLRLGMRQLQKEWFVGTRNGGVIGVTEWLEAP